MDKRVKELIEKVNLLLEEKELSENNAVNKENLDDLLNQNKKDVANFVNDFIYTIRKLQMSKEGAIDYIGNFCNALREANAAPCADYIKPLLLKKLGKYNGRFNLKIKLNPLAIIIFLSALVLGFVGYKFYTSVNTSHPILSIKGLESAIAVSQKAKIATNDDNPMPKFFSQAFGLSEQENKYYASYLNVLKYVVTALAQDDEICNADDWNNGEKFPALLATINNYLKEKIADLPADTSDEELTSLIVSAVQQTFSCSTKQ